MTGYHVSRNLANNPWTSSCGLQIYLGKKKTIVPFRVLRAETLSAEKHEVLIFLSSIKSCFVKFAAKIAIAELVRTTVYKTCSPGNKIVPRIQYWIKMWLILVQKKFCVKAW